MLGIALMVPWQDPIQHHFSYVGAACALGAGLCWAFYIYFGQKVVTQNIGMHALTIGIGVSASPYYQLVFGIMAQHYLIHSTGVKP
jgi:inner membrane transporter RhtA